MNDSKDNSALRTIEIVTVTGKGSGSQADDSQVKAALTTSNGYQSNFVYLASINDDGHETNYFQQGDMNKFRSDQFDIDSEDGPLTSIIFGVDNKDDWDVTKTFVTDYSLGRAYHTTESSWISNGSHTFTLSQYNERSGVTTDQNSNEWFITVTTADESNAETNDHVFLQMFDSHGNGSEFILLNNFLGEFNRGESESFTFKTTLDLTGPITRILLQKEETNGWKPQSVRVEQRGVISTDDFTTTFSFSEWLDGEQRWALRECNESFIYI
ncbi:PLAT/LH2 domain-containing protein [Kluyvera intermedia]|uniref:PLAT/LH2 domain-containing protein n=1 Tax=Kluyvera intermedia TaxID=61648 RepID=UPI003526AE4A